MKFKMPEYIEVTDSSFYTVGYSQEESCFSLLVNSEAVLYKLCVQFFDVPQVMVVGPDTYEKLSSHPVNGSIHLYQGINGSSNCSDIRFYASQANQSFQGNKGNFRIESHIDEEDWVYNKLKICHYKDNTTSTPSGVIDIDAAGLLSAPNISANHIASQTATFNKLQGLLETLYASEQLGALYLIDIKIERFSGSSSTVVDNAYISRGTYICRNKLIKASDNENYSILALDVHAHVSYLIGDNRHHFFVLQDIYFSLSSGQTETSYKMNILAVYAGRAPYNQITPY